jgi:EAL domain-containing protein (putative c-di-GMP-specific phosphodiesterase class I)
MSDERIVGAEALVRWQHPTDGLRAPGDFIEVAEQTGLIVPIGAWVLEEATRELARWSAELDRHEPMMLSVNVSAVQLRDPGLVDVVARAVAAARIDPSRVLIEITESVVVAPELVDVVAALRELGVGIAIDDFGTGYSSLSYLQQFPIQTLKIDRSFVGDIRADETDASIVNAIVAMARGLRLDLIAEGVENRTQLRYLHARGCSEGQGFLFSRPVPASEITTMVRSSPFEAVVREGTANAASGASAEVV